MLRNKECARITDATAWKGHWSLRSPLIESNFSGFPCFGPPLGSRVRVLRSAVWFGSGAPVFGS